MKYTVTTLEGNLAFNPTELNIVVRDKFVKKITVEDEIEEMDMIRVDSILIEKLYKSETIEGEEVTTEIGQTTQVKEHEFPFAYWSGMIDGYNAETKQPILNQTKLNTILAQFNLKTV
jgi:hypothetical protein